ncbi:MAG: hypothetical protein IPH28_21175 [Cytophagaceae bacterium]|nr:hypothetical protein [Cytophagaceae bacterium]
MKQMKLFSEKELAVKPQTRLEAIIYFWAHLDIEMIDSFLKIDRTYQDFPKYLFVSKLDIDPLSFSLSIDDTPFRFGL